MYVSRYFELQHEGRCSCRFDMTSLAGNHLDAADAGHSGKCDKDNSLDNCCWRVDQTQELAQYAVVEMLNG